MTLDISRLIQEHQRKIPLTLHEKGITATTLSFSPLIEDADWWAAKTYFNYLKDRPYTDDEKRASALRIVDAVWSAENSTDVRDSTGGKELVFITVPSTSGVNRLVPALAIRISQDLGLDPNVSILSGETLSKALHSEQMKNVSHEDRPYVSREFLVLSPEKLREHVAGRAVVVVEDTISSGASVKGFCDALAEAGVQVTTVVGLMGDCRLECEPQMMDNLQEALHKSNISITREDIAAVLSRGQVQILIENINKAQGQNEYAGIADKLQGILNSRAARYFGENQWRDQAKGSVRYDERISRLCDGVRTDLCGPMGKRPGKSERSEAEPGVKQLMPESQHAAGERRLHERRAGGYPVERGAEKPQGTQDQPSKTVKVRRR